jgi:hypothetical protein
MAMTTGQAIQTLRDKTYRLTGMEECLAALAVLGKTREPAVVIEGEIGRLLTTEELMALFAARD